MKTINYGSKASSNIYKKDNTTVIVDLDICNCEEKPFDYDLYTQTQNALVQEGSKVLRFLKGNIADDFLLDTEINYSSSRYDDAVSVRADASPVEYFFEERFAECYGPSALEYLYKEYPIVSASGTNLFLDYAVCLKDGRVIAVEENGVNYHHPQIIGEKAYRHQLEKQNICSENGIKLYRFSSMDCNFPDRIKEEILTYFGDSTNFKRKNITVQRPFELYDYQALKVEDLKQKHNSGKNEALLIVLPTATGKTQIILEDLESLYKANQNLKVLAVSPTIEVCNKWRQDFNTYNFPHSFESGTYNLLWKKLNVVDPSYYDYIIVDEAHHAVAPMISKALKYFTPKMLVGLTATPDRLDNKRLETIFGQYEVSLTLQEAMDKDIISKVRVFRLETNLDLSSIRYKGKDYVNSDLEKAISIDSRDTAIVEVIKKNFPLDTLKGVIFCINIKHAQRIATMLNASGIPSTSVSSLDRNANDLIHDFSAGKYKMLCSCAMLNEGWNEPDINLMVMARPTLSKVLYTQQLGRGLRRTDSKKEVFVIDVVDQYGALLKPWTAHSLFGYSNYIPFAALGTNYRVGDEINLFGYYETITSIRELDITTFEDLYKDYLSTEQAARELFISTGTLVSWIKTKKVLPDLSIPFGKSSLNYFKLDTLDNIRLEKQLVKHTDDMLKTDFMEFIKENQFTFSFKITFLLAFMKAVDINGDANLAEVLKEYMSFYQEREAQGLPLDRPHCVLNETNIKDKTYMKLNMLKNPFEKFERKRFIYYGKDIAMLSFNPKLWMSLSDSDKQQIVGIMEEHLKNYYKDLGKTP